MSTTKTVGVFALFTIIGAPLVWIIWEAANSLLSGRPDEVNYLVLLPAILIFVGVLGAASRVVRRLDAPT